MLDKELYYLFNDINYKSILIKTNKWEAHWD